MSQSHTESYHNFYICTLQLKVICKSFESFNMNSYYCLPPDSIQCYCPFYLEISKKEQQSLQLCLHVSNTNCWLAHLCNQVSILPDWCWQVLVSTFGAHVVLLRPSDSASRDTRIPVACGQKMVPPLHRSLLQQGPHSNKMDHQFAKYNIGIRS